MARSVKQVLSDHDLYDLDDEFDQISADAARTAMVKSRSVTRTPIKASKPIGKKHYRKTIRRDNVLYVADGLIDEKGMMTYSPIDSDSI
jgi:hypothetical protein